MARRLWQALLLGHKSPRERLATTHPTAPVSQSTSMAVIVLWRTTLLLRRFLPSRAGRPATPVGEAGDSIEGVSVGLAPKGQNDFFLFAGGGLSLSGLNKLQLQATQLLYSGGWTRAH